MRSGGSATLATVVATLVTNLAQFAIQEWRLDREAQRAERIEARSGTRLEKLHGCREGYSEAVQDLVGRLAECKEGR